MHTADFARQSKAASPSHLCPPFVSSERATRVSWRKRAVVQMMSVSVVPFTCHVSFCPGICLTVSLSVFGGDSDSYSCWIAKHTNTHIENTLRLCMRDNRVESIYTVQLHSGHNVCVPKCVGEMRALLYACVASITMMLPIYGNSFSLSIVTKVHVIFLNCHFFSIIFPADDA